MKEFWSTFLFLFFQRCFYIFRTCKLGATSPAFVHFQTSHVFSKGSWAKLIDGTRAFLAYYSKPCTKIASVTIWHPCDTEDKHISGTRCCLVQVITWNIEHEELPSVWGFTPLCPNKARLWPWSIPISSKKDFGTHSIVACKASFSRERVTTLTKLNASLN